MSHTRRILLGVDGNLSPATQHALDTASVLLQLSPADAQLILLHVIPSPYDITFTWGRSFGPARPFPPVAQQRQQAEHVLWRARTLLRQKGIAPARIEWLQRVGTPADEIVKLAEELGVDNIVIGSQGNALAQRLRRMLAGSTSRRVLRLAQCTVTLVVPPCEPHAGNLQAWYAHAVTHSLQEHPGSMVVLTAHDVAQTFAPPQRAVGSIEV
jgi:nucleotide-binding universal stress UspA family protein